MKTFTQQLIDRFYAIDDADNRHEILCYQDKVTSRLIDGTVTTATGLKSFRTTNGIPVNQLNADTFQIVQGNITVRKITDTVR